MKRLTLFQTAACATLFFAAVPEHALSSDQWLKTTIIDFSNPVRVPGKTLPPGKYTFKLVQSPAEQLQVQIFNERQSEILATVNTSPLFRMTPPDKTTILFYEAPVGQPEPIKAWLYPGDQYGREFIYGKSEAALIAMAARNTDQTAVAQNTSAPEATAVQSQPIEQEKTVESPAVAVEPPAPAAAPVTAQPELQPPPQEPSQAAVENPAPVAEQPAQAPAVTPTPEPTILPSTGSELPTVGLIGLLSLAGAVVLRVRSAS